MASHLLTHRRRGVSVIIVGWSDEACDLDTGKATLRPDSAQVLNPGPRRGLNVAGVWEQEKWHRPVSTEGAIDENLLEIEPANDWDDHSRGGTRTRDPGIMSAVL